MFFLITTTNRAELREAIANFKVLKVAVGEENTFLVKVPEGASGTFEANLRSSGLDYRQYTRLPGHFQPRTYGDIELGPIAEALRSPRSVYNPANVRQKGSPDDMLHKFFNA